MPPLTHFQKSCLAVAIGSAVSLPATAAIIDLNTADCDTLINAIESANTDAVVMNGASQACIAGSGADTIVLQNSSLSYAVPASTTYGPTALPDISSDITVQGNAGGASLITRSTGDNLRFFVVDATGDLTLSNITLDNGKSDIGGSIRVEEGSLTLDSIIIRNSNATDYGGAISANDAVVTIENESTLTLNNSPVCGAVSLERSSLSIANSTVAENYASMRYGGVSSGELYALTISDSVFSNNQAMSRAGALGANSGGLPVPISISNSTFSGNQAMGTAGNGFGGALYLYELLTTITNTNFNDNYARNGGGALYVKGYDSQLTITTGTIKDNSTTVTVESGTGEAEGKGGGICSADTDVTLNQVSVIGNVVGQGGGLIANSSGDVTINASTFYINAVTLQGGGIHQTAGNLTINSSTFSANNAADTGGAIFQTGSVASINNSTLYDNGGTSTLSNAMTPSFVNTVVGGSSGMGCAFGAGLSADLANNWFQDASCTGTAQGSPKLNELQDNNAGLSGITLTHAPALSSPLLAAGNAASCAGPLLGFDQRGAPRPICDIGAVEGGIKGRFDEETCFVAPTSNGRLVTFCL